MPDRSSFHSAKAPLFNNRSHAGQILAKQVSRIVTAPGALVLALPRGGVPVGFEVASALGADLDVFVVRKLGLPGEEELAIGAIASGGTRALNRALIEELQISASLIERIANREAEELARREQLYRGGRPPISIANRAVILVDDGLATGATMKAAARAVRLHGPKSLLIAVPVASAISCEELREDADWVICAATPERFTAVGSWYKDFRQTEDDEVQALLQRAEQANLARSGTLN